MNQLVHRDRQAGRHNRSDVFKVCRYLILYDEKTQKPPIHGKKIEDSKEKRKVKIDDKVNYEIKSRNYSPFYSTLNCMTSHSHYQCRLLIDYGINLGLQVQLL